MALETASYINGLVATNPTATDTVAQADDHLRLIKSAVKATFPNITGAATATHTELNVLDGITATTSELNILDGVTATTAELNLLDGVTATTAELNILDGVTATAGELNILDGVTATATELNVLDGITATTTELNYVDGVTSNIQTQLDTLDTAVSSVGGKVLQVVAGFSSTSTSHTSTSSYTDSAVTVNITPSSASSKILIMANIVLVNSGNYDGAGVRVVRNGTAVRTYPAVILIGEVGVTFSSGSAVTGTWSGHMLDTPASTSQLTYTIQVRKNTNVSSSTMNSKDGDIVVMEIAA